MPSVEPMPPAVHAPAIEYVRPPLYPKQEAFLFTPARYSITEASTKTGKTVGCLVWEFEQAALGKGDGRNYWWVAPTGGVAKIAFRRLKRYVPRALYTTNETEMTMTLVNGAVIWFKGSDRPDSLYGEDVYAAVIDEATRCKEDAWIAVRSTVTATRAPIRIIGNVKGKKNWAYKLARLAQSGAPDMSYHKLTAYDAVDGGVLELAEVEDAKRLLTPEIFNELYLAEPTDDGGNPFGIKAIELCVAPLSTRPAICWGWDLAKSHDFTVGIGLDDRGHVCEFERWQGPWRATIGKIKQLTRGLPALVDSTGVGDPVLEALQADGGQNFEGFKFSSSSKQQLMEGLAVAIQSQLTRFPDGPIRNELDTFEFEYTRTGVLYSAPAGLHDDCVMGLALARRHYSAPRSTLLVA
jgi:phage FluMu gp28-like protein